jgi:predicted aspartyl protease
MEEGSMDGKYLIMTCTLSLNGKEIPTHTLIDCGAMGYAFIDQDFANCHEFPQCPLKIPHVLEVIDR